MHYASHRYGILFYTLLASLIISPLARPLGLGNVVEFFLAANLIAAVLAVGEGLPRRTALAAMAIALALRPGAAWLNQDTVSTASMAVWGVIAIFAAANAIAYALRGQSVSHEKIYAALSAYLLAGFFFGLLFWVMERLSPVSLTVGGAPAAVMPLSTTIYYSFVTLASLGYGDVLPLSDPARGLAVVEVVSGQLYLAVMVARLVGAWR